VAQLEILQETIDGAGLCTGKVKPAVRIKELKEKQIIFGTLQLVQEALDEPTLDTLFFLTPFGSSYVEDGGFNTLQQGMGRIQRVQEGKKRPIVVIMDHVYVSPFHRMCSQLKRQLRSWPEEQGGPLPYKVIKPYSGGLK
jgi:superfamily II DNA or RNA helicase